MKNEKTIEEIIEKKKKDNYKKTIMIIIVIILIFIFWLVGYRMGKIGFRTIDVSSNPEEKVEIIKVYQEDGEIEKDTKLNIFSNIKFNGEEKIAPQSKGSYQFCISNEVEDNIVYSINFTDEMEHLINMKYRLKIDNIYIKGNKDTYVDIDELSIEDIKVLKNSNNVYTLEWYWEDSDVEDTFVGGLEETQYYVLRLKIDAKKLN